MRKINKVYHRVLKWGANCWDEAIRTTNPKAEAHQHINVYKTPYHLVELTTNTVIASNMELQDLTYYHTTTWPKLEAVKNGERIPSYATSQIRDLQQRIDRLEALLQSSDEMSKAISLLLRQVREKNEQACNNPSDSV